MRFSPSTGTFYPESLHYPKLPDDLMEITEEQHREAINGPLGTTWGVRGGLFVTIAPPPMPKDVGQTPPPAAG